MFGKFLLELSIELGIKVRIQNTLAHLTICPSSMVGDRLGIFKFMAAASLETCNDLLSTCDTWHTRGIVASAT